MRPQVSDIFGSEDSPCGICVADGYGLRIGVERNHLVVADGIGRSRRVRRFSRSGRGLRRVVVLGNSGTITLDALRFLGDIRIPLVHVDLEGRVLGLSCAEGTDNPALRRAQALAAGTDHGMDIVRRLIDAKIRGQLGIARRLGGSEVVPVIEAALDDLAAAARSDEILHAEAVAASVYWQAWQNVPVRFIKADSAKVPSHWLTFGQRRSPLSQSARSAVGPGNACLNYLYALLVAEARIACLTMGLDPGLGILHADKANRDSLVADVMESVRPQIDGWLLDLLDRRTFRASDFTETRQGVCRVLAPLSHELAESATFWGREVGPVVERVASQLAKASQGAVRRVSSPLTGRSRAAAARRTLQEARGGVKRPKSRIPGATCRTCGAPVSRPGYRYCDACRPEAKLDAGRSANRASTSARRARQTAGLPDPSSTPEARARLARSIGPRNEEAMVWAAAHPDLVVGRADFVTIQTALSKLTGPAISKATGLSKSYASDIRRGRYVPHARHWPALADLAGVRCPIAKNGPPDGGKLGVEAWRKIVLPALASVPTTMISEATGLSCGSASKVRRGLQVPHPRHWPALAALAASQDGKGSSAANLQLNEILPVAEGGPVGSSRPDK